MSRRAGAGDRQPPDFDRENQNEDRSQRKAREGEPQQTHHAHGAILPSRPAQRRRHACRHSQSQRQQERRHGQLQRIGIARQQQMSDRVVQTQGPPQVSVQHSPPIVDILHAERLIQSILMAQRGDV